MTEPPRRFRRIALHLTRVSLFVLIMVLIRVHHVRTSVHPNRGPGAPVGLERLRQYFPTADSVAEESRGNGGREVFDAAAKSLGYILQTSPQSDHLIGFSGPTNALVVFDAEDRIVAVDVLSSGDTREHVRQVLEDKEFLRSFRGFTWKEVSARIKADAVAGATLTSLAIQESIIHRLSGGRPSLRFPDPLKVEDARAVFQGAPCRAGRSSLVVMACKE